MECGIQPKLNKIKEYDAIIKIDQDKIKDYIEDYIEVSKDEIDLQIEYMKKNLVYETRGKYIFSLMKRNIEFL